MLLCRKYGFRLTARYLSSLIVRKHLWTVASDASMKRSIHQRRESTNHDTFHLADTYFFYLP